MEATSDKKEEIRIRIEQTEPKKRIDLEHQSKGRRQWSKDARQESTRTERRDENRMEGGRAENTLKNKNGRRTLLQPLRRWRDFIPPRKESWLQHVEWMMEEITTDAPAKYKASDMIHERSKDK